MSLILRSKLEPSEPSEHLDYRANFYRFFTSNESIYLSPEEAERVKQSLKELEEGEYEDFANADDLISNLKSDKD